MAGDGMTKDATVSDLFNDLMGFQNLVQELGLIIA